MKAMKCRYKKVLSVTLASALIITTGITGASVYAAKSSAGSQTTQQTTQAAITKEQIESVVKDIHANQEETVYVISNTDGSTKQIIVSNWLKNPNQSATLTDHSDLQDVTNVKGDESFQVNANGERVWQADGKDIYYQGTSDQQLPVEMEINYLLDGKEISASELAGKSGKVTIRIAYTNNQKRMVTINGTQQEMYVPFVMATGMVLENDKFTNVQISGGKIVNDGDKTVVVGVALPGMQQNLGVSKDVVEIPETVEITADVKDFALTTTMTLGLSDVFRHIDLDQVDSVDKLKSALDSLDSATGQLADGSGQLYDGLSELLNKSSALTSGIEDLYQGTADLNQGTEDLKEGTGKLTNGVAALKKGSQDLKDGTTKLDAGLSYLVSKNSQLTGGAKQVFEQLLGTVDQQLTPIFAAIHQNQVKLTIENYSLVLNGLIQKMPNPTIAKQLTDAKEKLDDYNQFYQGVLAYTDGVSDAGKGVKDLNEGVDKLQNGVGDLESGSNDLADGSIRLNNGSEQLLGGVSQLKEGGGNLIDGIAQLKDGAMALRDGLQEFKSTGVDKLIQAYQGDIEPLCDRLRAVSDLSAGYQTFSGLADGQTGSVKFIYRTEEIK